MSSSKGIKLFQLAKDLEINSKLLVEKLQTEQIPGIENYQSTVSHGLEATIREWHKTGELADLVEKSKHIPIKSKKKAPAKATINAEAGGDTATMVAEAPGETETQADTQSDQATETEPIDEAQVETAETEIAAPVETQIKSTEAVTQTAVPVHAPAPVGDKPVDAAVTVAVEAEPAVPHKEHHKEHKEHTSVAATPAAAATHEAPAAPVAPVAPVKPVLQKPVRPTVKAMGIPNVPTRPINIIPMGTRLVPKPAELQGPKVVRMEQPDNLPAPRRAPRPNQSNGGNGGVGPQSSTGPRPAAFGPAPVGPSATPGRARTSARGGSPIVDDEEAMRAKKGLKGRSARRHGTGRFADAGAADIVRTWREADLAEYEERISSAGGYLKERRREVSKSQQRQSAAHSPAQKPDHIEIIPPVTLRELSEAIGIKSSDLLKKLMSQGVMATVNQSIDGETAQVLALEFGVEVVIKQRESEYQVLEREYKELEEKAERSPRPPVVTILGHVDHGKTSLLDKIRSANVASGEAGGITQHVGAYTVELAGSDGKLKRVTFLDTPGHQAFTAMRARGANITDVIVLVVAADDGVMPQTIESINHAKAANVTIVVAMNKIDKAEANPNKVLGQLAEHGLNPTEWGGDTEVVRTSAVTGQGIKELIEYLDYTASLKELKASPQLPARGAVVESFMDPLRGVIARVLVQNGTLKIGDVVVCGPSAGRVRVLIDDKNKQITEAGPATPVEVIGLDAVPAAGDRFYVVEDLTEAKAIAEERSMADRAGEIAQRNKVTLENLFDTIRKEDIKELRMILKADVQGSVDVLKQMMTEELSKEVKVRLLHAAVGGISESDVLLADASNAIIVGFSVVPDEAARKMAEDLGVEVRLYRIIYEITDDIRKALTGMLAPSKQDQTLGHAEIRQVIKISRVGNVVGCMVTDGVLQRNNKYRLVRDGIVVAENLLLESLKRFKEDIKEVRGGLECGIKIAGYDDLKVGDRLEAYKTVDVARTL